MCSLLKLRNLLLFKNLNLARQISTSKNNIETDITIGLPRPNTIQKKRKRDWMFYGFDPVDEKMDYMIMHSVSFFSYTLFFCGGIFILAYYPDMMEWQWFQREAYIELRRREVLGLPLIDPNYTDPATVRLPPDEEIGDDEIVI